MFVYTPTGLDKKKNEGKKCPLFIAFYQLQAKLCKPYSICLMPKIIYACVSTL